MIKKLIIPSVECIDALSNYMQYRWRRFISSIISLRFSGKPMHVFIGKECIIKGHKHIHLNGSFVALDRNRIEAICSHDDQIFSPKIIFGDGLTMEYGCHIGCIEYVEIGNNVLFASGVYISDHSHGDATKADLWMPPNKRKITSKGPVVIEDEVWLGEGSVVLPNVRIGRSSIIGANAVVTRDIPPFSVAVGAPARVIKCLNSPSISTSEFST